MQKWLNSKETMQVLGCSRTTLYRIVKRGELIPAWLGREQRFCESDLEEYLESRRGRYPEEVERRLEHEF